MFRKVCTIEPSFFNPLVPSAANMQRNAKILILEGIIKKFSMIYVPKNYEKKNSGSKGLRRRLGMSSSSLVFY